MVVCGGAGLLCDLDTTQSTAAKSLGLVTKLIARGVAAGSLVIYHATRSPGDVVDRKSGHRAASHTIPFCVLAGGLVGLLCLLSPIAAAVSCALLGGLLACGFRKAGLLLAVSTGAVSWWTLTSYSGWSWLLSVAVFVGCLVHILGDTITCSGTPILWPLVSGGKRWRLVSTPITFTAGDSVETGVVAPLLVVSLVVAVSAVTGLLPAVVSAVVSSSS